LSRSIGMNHVDHQFMTMMVHLIGDKENVSESIINGRKEIEME
jgi:hypothetical protein